MSLKFSIVTPSLNQGRFIRDTIESVRNQDYENFEHIIIDGGSTDETINILNEYSHLKWISEKDSGIANAINKGFRFATGDIYAWINADDYYDINVFKTIGTIFDKHNELDLVIGNLSVVDINKNVFHKDKTIHFNKDYLINYSADVIRQPASFFTRRIFSKMGGLDETLKIVFDYDLFIKMLYFSRPFFIDYNCAFYRDHDFTLTRNNLPRQAIEIFNVSKKYDGRLISKLNYTNAKKIFFPSRFLRK